MRDAALRAPYLHDGSEKTLEVVIEFYNKGGGKDPNLDPLMVPLALSAHEQAALVAFIKALTASTPRSRTSSPFDARDLHK